MPSSAAATKDDIQALFWGRCCDPLCNAVFTICSGCYRGQRYCSDACRTRMRRLQQRAATRRYQASPTGRENHCRRQQAYRDRQKPVGVTHQGLVSITSSVSKSPPSLSHCIVCGLHSRWIDPFAMYRLPSDVRRRRRRHRASAHVQISTFSDDR